MKANKFTNAYVITGCIGSGKSTVINLLKLYGFSVIDADVISHKILDENVLTIEQTFGKEFVCGSKVDRKKLGALVFGDKSQLKLLEDILHPLIRDKIYKEALNLEIKGLPYFVDIPLFFEKQGYDFNNVLLIYAPKDTLIARVMSRDKLSKKEALQRLECQLDIELKKQKASFVISNDKDLKHLNLEVDNFIRELKERYATLKI
ncbi:dephospho-CoA kinase [Campylobacter hyointestinalis subsp. hyointestinalis]|nr:dephospho-CoA kinase [Campylobacter hyointestinalis]PPB53443.1 dephospho-CoA kinase [Campylobacter hyointestinalis subsp. hyointestinalis]PPB66332.1 dephospho-CoA kinase [Campylobacter hyointestinalis subsp. hyointestinalis]